MSASKWKPYPEYRVIPHAGINKIPNHWNSKRIRNVFRERGEVSEDGTEELLSVSKYTGVKVRSTTTDREARAASLVGYKKCEPNDIVSNIMLAWDSALGVAFDSGIVSSAYEVYVPQQEIDPHFLDLLLRTPEYRVAFTIVSKGIVPSRWRMYTESFNDIQMILPPLNEQKQIGNFVHRINENISRNIENLETQKSLLEEKRSALITQAVTKGLYPDVEMKDSGINWIDTIPQHWQEVQLRWIVRMQSGTNITSLEIEAEGTYPVFGGNGLRGYIENYTHEGDHVLIGRQGALCGCINYAHGKFWPSEHAVVVSPTIEIDYLWLGEMLRSMNLGQYSQSAAQPGLSVDRISSLKIPLPPLEEQRKISLFIKNKTKLFNELKDSIFYKKEKIEEYRISLISAAVTGKIDVRNRTTPAETSSTDSHPQTARVSGTDRLNQLRKPPKQVYQKGTLLDELDLTRSVAIVGSRGVSDEGLAAARALGKSTAEAGHIVVSGLANGIDTAAFEGALEGGGMCVIVLPSGVDIITPRGNKDLAQRILDAGGTIVSEQPNGTNARKFMFIERNRMIAALSDTVVLGEARENGGAWHTVKAAWALKKSTLKLHNDGSTTPLVNPQRELM